MLLVAGTNDTVTAIDVATGAVFSTLTPDPTPNAVNAPSLAVAANGTIYQTDNTDNALRILHLGTVLPNHPPTVGVPVVSAPDMQSGVVTGSIVASDPDGDTLTYTVTTAPTSGSVTMQTDGTFTYTPSANGRLLADNSPGGQLADQFVVTIWDGRTTATSGVAVTVLPLESTLKTGTYSFDPPVFTLGLDPTAEFTRRKAMEFPVDPYKLRVHIANFNLFGYNFGGALDDISLYIGEAELGGDGMPDGNFVPGTQVRLAIAPTLAAGQWGTSDWLVDGKDFNFDPDKLYIFSYGFGIPGGNLTVTSGADEGWGSASAGDAGLTAPTMNTSQQGYLDVWFEYQYADQGQPSLFVVAPSVAWNNSNAVGTLGELDTFPNQWAEAAGGVIAGNIAVSAVFATVFGDPASPRWAFFDDKVEIPLDPDGVLYLAINTNDWASDSTAVKLNQIEQDTLRAVQVGDVKFPDAVQILSDIPARINSTQAMDAERRALNAWTYTLPGNVDVAVRIADLLGDGADPERLKPQYTTEGVHWTPPGAAVVAQQIIASHWEDSSPSAIPTSVLASMAPLALQTQIGADASLTCTVTVDSVLPCGVDPQLTDVQQSIQSTAPKADRPGSGQAG